MPPGRGLAEPDLSSGCQDEVHGDLDEEVPQVQGGHRKGGGLPVYELHQVSHRVLLALSRHLPEVQSKELYDVVKQAFKAKTYENVFRHTHNGQPCQPPKEDASTSRTVEAEDKDGLGERDR